MGFFRKRQRFNLALQGGGAHGAFTWGVLDRLLEDDKIDFGWVSATSAGALNAVAMASGLASAGREGARKSLDQVWKAVYKAGAPDLLRMNPFLYRMSRSPAMAQMAGLWSPYDLNPMGFDPLRRLLEETVDFERIRTQAPIELLIAATDVATGRARLFRTHELTVECVLASACLPTMHHAVNVDGKAYWDGGFSANPDIKTLAAQSPINDTLIVQINPLVKHNLPTGAGEIAAHVNQLTFNAPLMRDVEIIETVRKTCASSWERPTGPMSQLARHRFHLIDAAQYTGSLSPQTKMKPDWGLFTYLHGAGRIQTEKWLERHRSAIGKRSSVDLKAHFLDDRNSTNVLESASPTQTTHDDNAPERPGTATVIDANAAKKNAHDENALNTDPGTESRSAR